MNDSIGASIANKWGLGGGFTTVLYGWLTSANTAVFIGMMATLIGLVASLYFQRLKHNREKQAHESNELLKQHEEARRDQEELRKKELHEAQLKYYMNYDHAKVQPHE